MTLPSNSTPGASGPRGTSSFTLPIIAASFLVGTLTYGCVLWYLLSNRTGVQPVGVSPALRMALYVLAALALVGAVVWTRLRLSPAAEGAPAGPGDPGASPLVFQRDTILALALAEAAAIIGFVVGFLSGSINDFLYTGVPTVMVMAVLIIPTVFRYVNRA